MQKIFTGRVVSTKQLKTVVVEVERFFKHTLYERRQRVTKRYPVHSEQNLNIGDTVRFVETRPMSKTKRWKIVEETTANSKQPTAKNTVEKPAKVVKQRKEKK